MGVSRKQIADYERGLALPNSDMVIRLAITLKITTDLLLGLKGLTFADADVANVRFTRRLKALEMLPESKKRVIVKLFDEFIGPA
ncbi:hypothetical protein AGMMS50267_02090 [Spirochaetia bacterium]|nr:hypothetical protein AGMMS50267_02090 [Spirochaetia bacterium]